MFTYIWYVVRILCFLVHFQYNNHIKSHRNFWGIITVNTIFFSSKSMSLVGPKIHLYDNNKKIAAFRSQLNFNYFPLNLSSGNVGTTSIVDRAPRKCHQPCVPLYHLFRENEDNVGFL
jgi:hypothetical protein